MTKQEKHHVAGIKAALTRSQQRTTALQAELEDAYRMLGYVVTAYRDSPGAMPAAIARAIQHLNRHPMGKQVVGIPTDSQAKARTSTSDALVAALLR